MKNLILFCICLFSCGIVSAQQNDPVVMTVAGEAITRSEFEYNFNKNNSDVVVDKKSIREYADLFAVYKMKVRAALDSKMDTLASFQKEYRHYRDLQIRPLLVPATEEPLYVVASNEASIPPHVLSFFAVLLSKSVADCAAS